MSKSNLCPSSRKICGGLTEFGPGMDRDWMYCVHGRRFDKDWTKTGQRLDFVSMSRQPSVTSTDFRFRTSRPHTILKWYWSPRNMPALNLKSVVGRSVSTVTAFAPKGTYLRAEYEQKYEQNIGQVWTKYERITRKIQARGKYTQNEAFTFV